MSLDLDRVRTWYRADGSEALEYVMGVDDLVTDPEELQAAIDAGMRITVTVGTGPRSVTSLAFLAPVIENVRDLWVNTINQITDVEILSRGRSLRSLAIATGPVVGRADLSALPLLEQFGGYVTRAVASVLRNPQLRFLRAAGAIPKSFAQVVGPIEIFEQEGARSQTLLPEFARPEAMRNLRRVGSAEFNLAQLVSMTGLTKLSIGACDDLIGLTELSKIGGLQELEINGCGTRESWDGLPMVASAFLNDITPLPSEEFLATRRQAGWLVPQTYDPASFPALALDEAGDEDDSWGVFMSRFTDLADAADLLDDNAVASGIIGEYFLLGIVAELQSQGVQLDPVPDSEGSFTAVYFPDREQGEQVFARANELLAVDPELQARYLRTGSSWAEPSSAHP